jgi:uncharacterized membrane protein
VEEPQKEFDEGHFRVCILNLVGLHGEPLFRISAAAIAVELRWYREPFVLTWMRGLFILRRGIYVRESIKEL